MSIVNSVSAVWRILVEMCQFAAVGSGAGFAGEVRGLGYPCLGGWTVRSRQHGHGTENLRLDSYVDDIHAAGAGLIRRTRVCAVI